MKDNQEEGGGSKGELQGATHITTTKKKMKIGEFTNMMKCATNTIILKFLFPM